VHGEVERQKKGVAMCTPYTEMVTVRDRVLCDNSVLKQQNQQLTNELYVVQAASITASSTSSQLQSKVASLESEMVRLRHEYESKVTQERKRREDDIQSLIIQHNSQLAELKKLYKGIKNAGVKRPEMTSKENNLTSQNPNGHIKPTKQVPSMKPTTSKPSGDSKLARSKTTTQLKETDATTITPSTSDESLRLSSDESLGFASDELLKSPDKKARNTTNDAVLNVEEQPRVLGSFDTERKTDNFTNIAFCSIDQYDETAMRMEKLIEEILNSEIVYPMETDKKERMKYTNFSF
jgi:DNA-binding protein H-NS